MQTQINSTLFDYSNPHATIKALQDTRKPDYIFTDFCAVRERLILHKTDIVAALNRLTIKEIDGLIHKRSDKKANMVRELWDALLSMFNIARNGITFSLYEGPEAWEKKIIEEIRAVTQETFNTWQQQRAVEKAAFNKALTDPETLEEFRRFITYKGEKALSTEQRARYDELMTGTIKERKDLEQSRRAQVTAVQVGETELLIKESFHAKKQIPLWVVQLSERVERHIFDDLKARADKLGGYYSSYRGHGAIPGFTFERQNAAQLFTQIKDGDVNAAELRAAINAEKTQQRAESLQAKAETMEERATDELERDRRTNTARRARIASHAEQRAIWDIEFAKTLDKIGEMIKAGTVTHLTQLATIVQLEELYTIVNLAKWAYIREKKINSDKYEYTEEVIDFARFPFPVLYKDDATTLLEGLIHDNGKKLAAARMLKRLKAEKGEFITIREGRPMEDFVRLFLSSSASLTDYQKSRFKEQHQKFTRISKLGFSTIYELRAALRELMQIDKDTEISPEMKRLQAIRELERKFVSLDLPGFFPTPPDLAAEVVEKAQIEPHHTVCEPGAGLGHLAEALTEKHPDCNLVCIEMYQPLVEALKLKNFDAIHKDFLTYQDQTFDRIVMNPPFEDLGDIDHVNHAWSLLKPGGRLVAIMANNKSRDTEKVRKFRELVDQYGIMEQNDPDAFLSAFRPTSVRTITVILDKPATSKPIPTQGVQASLFADQAA